MEGYLDNYDKGETYPNKVLDFLKSELHLGKRYVVLDIHRQGNGLLPLLYQPIHLLCSLTPDATLHYFLQKKYAKHDNFLSLHGQPDNIPIEDDSLDCICIDDLLLQFDPLRIAKEFERTLRLNSYVLFFQKRIKKQEGTFGIAFFKWLENQGSKDKIIAPLVVKSLVVDFFESGLYTQEFEQYQYLDWSELIAYAATFVADFDSSALKQLFDKHQQESRIKIAYQLHLTYGLFNKSVPEISLRKSIFFNLLRPFALGFYILVKANIYLWKSLYKIKEKIFQ